MDFPQQEPSLTVKALPNAADHGPRQGEHVSPQIVASILIADAAGKRTKRALKDRGQDAVAVPAAEKKRRTAKTAKVTATASHDHNHSNEDHVYAPDDLSKIEPCSRIRYRPLASPATPESQSSASSVSYSNAARPIRYFCPLSSLPSDTSLRPLPLVVIGVVAWLHTHATSPKLPKYTVARLGVPGSPTFIYAFILLDSDPSSYAPPRIGELIAIRHPTRLQPSSTTSPPAIATSPANLTRLGLAVDLATCASLGCFNYVPSTSSQTLNGSARCELHVMAQVHRSLNKRIELSGASTAPIMLHSGVGKGASVKYVKEVIASTLTDAMGGATGGDAGNSGRGGYTYYMREKVLVTHPRAETSVKENPKRKAAIDAILQKDNSPGAQNLRRVRQLADPTSVNLFEGDLANQQRKRQDDARVVASLDALNDARKRQREVRENQAAAKFATATLSLGSHAQGGIEEKEDKEVIHEGKAAEIKMPTGNTAEAGDMILLSDSSDDDT
ncbi:hypothetical protein BCR44DRAFT_1428400 [Catenaria anguillulae PL171]|uniref:Uncharacterized protein n=1 Tax=Catenaria anguillulae PL171 TaxID=765915 RepID=A0A1Y2HX30_9FUNG|nr:hypothetical protein BCR44DRAFT_1428400 [Catenaria anguillulae PL171]